MECRFAMGLSEPDAGSDLFGLKTRAVPDGEEWIVRGQKVFTTGADTANFILLLVRTSLGAPTRQALTFLLIPPSTPGVTVRPLRKLAGQGTHTCEVFLDNARVTRDAVLGGEEGIGQRGADGWRDAERRDAFMLARKVSAIASAPWTGLEITRSSGCSSASPLHHIRPWRTCRADGHRH